MALNRSHSQTFINVGTHYERVPISPRTTGWRPRGQLNFDRINKTTRLSDWSNVENFSQIWKSWSESSKTPGSAFVLVISLHELKKHLSLNSPRHEPPRGLIRIQINRSRSGAQRSILRGKIVTHERDQSWKHPCGVRTVSLLRLKCEPDAGGRRTHFADRKWLQLYFYCLTSSWAGMCRR